MLHRRILGLLALALLVPGPGCDSSSVNAVGTGDGGSAVPTNRDACESDEQCPYWRCECADGFVAEGGVCASYGCENDSEVCAACEDHGGQGRTYLWDPGDWPEDAVSGGGGSTDGGTGSSSTLGGGSGGRGGSSGGNAGSGSSAGNGASGSGSASGASGGSAGSSAEAGVACTACPTADSSMLEYTYSCTGECNGMGTVSFASGPSYSCNSMSPIGDSYYYPYNPNGHVYADGFVLSGPPDYPEWDVPAVAFEGYAGGKNFPADLETCPKRKAPNFVNVDGAYSGAPKVKVTCTNRQTNEVGPETWLSISSESKDERVCSDCFAASGYAAFTGGFTYAGPVGMTVGSAMLVGQCVVTGSFTLGGCDTNVECVP